MAERIYRTPQAVLRAAMRMVGGRVTTYDDTAVLHVVRRGLSGQLVDIYLSDIEAARRAHLDYRPHGREEEW